MIFLISIQMQNTGSKHSWLAKFVIQMHKLCQLLDAEVKNFMRMLRQHLLQKQQFPC